ncbi:uncharacterized protein TNCV_1427721 [Trichonephila clavipes]|nr:uncharacterized protein TNCV_1427721 [Trichonephila clavipes]
MQIPTKKMNNAAPVPITSEMRKSPAYSGPSGLPSQAPNEQTGTVVHDFWQQWSRKGITSRPHSVTTDRENHHILHKCYLTWLVQPKNRGCGSPMFKVSDQDRHVMSSNPLPLKTRRVGQRCTLNLSRAETSSPWCGVVVRRGGAS